MDRQRALLEALGEAVNRLPPLQAKILARSPASPPMLHVVNPNALYMSEDIGCELQDGRDYWFTWSWGNTLGPANDPHGVAASIFRVLTPQVWPS